MGRPPRPADAVTSAPSSRWIKTENAELPANIPQEDPLNSTEWSALTSFVADFFLLKKTPILEPFSSWPRQLTSTWRFADGDVVKRTFDVFCERPYFPQPYPPPPKCKIVETTVPIGVAYAAAAPPPFGCAAPTSPGSGSPPPTADASDGGVIVELLPDSGSPLFDAAEPDAGGDPDPGTSPWDVPWPIGKDSGVPPDVGDGPEDIIDTADTGSFTDIPPETWSVTDQSAPEDVQESDAGMADAGEDLCVDYCPADVDALDTLDAFADGLTSDSDAPDPGEDVGAPTDPGLPTDPGSPTDPGGPGDPGSPADSGATMDADADGTTDAAPVPDVPVAKDTAPDTPDIPPVDKNFYDLYEGVIIFVGYTGGDDPVPMTACDLKTYMTDQSELKDPLPIQLISAPNATPLTLQQSGGVALCYNPLPPGETPCTGEPAPIKGAETAEFAGELYPGADIYQWYALEGATILGDCHAFADPAVPGFSLACRFTVKKPGGGSCIFDMNSNACLQKDVNPNTYNCLK